MIAKNHATFFDGFIVNFCKGECILRFNYALKTYFEETLGGFFGFKNPFPQNFEERGF